MMSPVDVKIVKLKHDRYKLDSESYLKRKEHLKELKKSEKAAF